VRAVVDDRLPYTDWTPTAGPDPQEIWDEVIEPKVESLREDAQREASATGAEVAVEVIPGSPPEQLIALSREVDLMVIGSRRWGSASPVPLGSTGEELMHDAGCSVTVVPRPSSTDSPLG
jgi:nucleotide-binding universal stress UspA family protein